MSDMKMMKLALFCVGLEFVLLGPEAVTCPFGFSESVYKKTIELALFYVSFVVSMNRVFLISSNLSAYMFDRGDMEYLSGVILRPGGCDLPWF